MNEILPPDTGNIDPDDLEETPEEKALTDILVAKMNEYIEDFKRQEASVPKRRIYDWQVGSPSSSTVTHLPLPQRLKWYQQSQLLDVACNLTLRSPTMQAFMQECDGVADLSIRVKDIPSHGYGYEDSILLNDKLDPYAWASVIPHEARHKEHYNQNLDKMVIFFGIKRPDFSAKAV